MFDFHWKKHRKKKEREKKMIKYMKIYMIALSLLVILLGGIDASAAARLQVSFIDAGQGSAIFIQSGGKNTLIDAGDEKYYEKLKKFLVKKKLKKIDQLVITHNDPDHIGNADKVISKYGVRTVIQAKYGYDREAKTKDVKSTVLQVSHHGSYTSSSTAFLKKAKPEYAVISCSSDGKN